MAGCPPNITADPPKLYGGKPALQRKNMPETYTIRVEARFEAAHNLREYYGKPEPLHGHSWKVEAKFLCSKLDHEDIGIDYVHAEEALKKLASRFDHRYINEVPPFDVLSPTSENLARWFFNELNTRETRQASVLKEVVVWEGPHASVSYSNHPNSKNN